MEVEEVEVVEAEAEILSLQAETELLVPNFVWIKQILLQLGTKFWL